MECTKCEHMAEKCAVEDLYGIGRLKACPYINEPVLNESGWLMNPPFTEKYLLTNGHIFLIPEETKTGWIINWIITKNGAGSCGKTKPDIYIISYKKAIDEIEKNDKINDLDRLEIIDIFDTKFDKRRTFIIPEIDQKIEEKQPEKIIEYVSPFEDLKHGKIVEQLDLFA